MELNADFTRRVVVHADAQPWVVSPMPGVERRMLDRIGDEVARATSLVRYAPGSLFAPHVHGGGEEFLVLDGVFEDEHGAYPAGTYVRNPPQTRHTPGSSPGCTLLVKLWQFDPADRTSVVLDADRLPPHPDKARPGVAVVPLHQDAREDVRIEQWAPLSRTTLNASGGAELFVLHGACASGGDTLHAWSWLRIPPGGDATFVASAAGARVWVKTGHLAAPVRVPQAAA